MATPIPPNMQALALNKYGPPSTYTILTVPTPQITSSNQVLIKVHAASINPTDIGTASGGHKIIISPPMPVKLGYDLSGVVVGVGDMVTNFKEGDEVFACLAFQERGSIAEYALTTESILVHKPKNLTHEEAASAPLVGMTALQGFEKIEGGLEGKTVFIPGGLSGVGSIAVQLAKNCLGAAKVITTVSTTKVPKVKELLGKDVVDQVIDYTTSDPNKIIPPHSVDILLDTSHTLTTYIPVLKKGGTMIFVAGLPSGQNLKPIVPEISGFFIVVLDFIDSIRRWRVSRHGVKYDSVLQKPSGNDMQRIAKWLEEGKVKPVVGKVVRLSDLQGIKDACTQIASGKGGIGKVIVQI